MSTKQQNQDHITIKNIACFTQIGVADNEREIGQNLNVDLDVFFDLSIAGMSDDLDDTVSYIELAKTVVSVSQLKPYKLLEHFATSICNSIFKNYEKIQSIGVTVHKPHIPDPSFVGQSSVYIYRTK